MKGAKNVSGLIDSRTQYGRPGAGAPGQSGMCRHIFSHPDYDRRLWHLTRSADPDVREGRRALAGSPHCMAYRRWGIAPRPEDVLHVVLTTFWIVRLSGFCGGICLLRVRVCSFRDGGWAGSFGAWRGGGPAGAGQRLRSGAFAPDCPCVIFVTAFGSSFRFPWAHRLPSPPGPPPRQALVSTLHRLWDGGCAWHFSAGRCGDGGSCGVAKKGRAGGRFWHWGVLRVRGALRAVGDASAGGGAVFTLPWRVFLPRLPIRRFRPLPRRLPLRAFLLSSFSFSAAPASCRGTGGCRTGSGSLPSAPW